MALSAEAIVRQQASHYSAHEMGREATVTRITFAVAPLGQQEALVTMQANDGLGDFKLLLQNGEEGWQVEAECE